MARKKEPPKPMSSLRFEFIASLENLCNEAVIMLQMTEALAKHDSLPPRLAQMLAERNTALRAALISGEEQ